MKNKAIIAVSLENSENQYHLFVVIVGIILITIAIAVLIGWQYHILVLTRISLSWVSMKANTAICFLLSGLVLILFGRGLNFVTCALVSTASMIILLIGSLTLFEFSTSINFSIDQLFINESPLGSGIYPGRMTFTTAINFILIAVAFLCLLGKRILVRVSHIFALMIFFISLLSLYNYVYGKNLNTYEFYTTMAVHTGLLFMLSSLSILLIKVDPGITEIILKNNIRGYYLRRLLPIVFLVPLLLTIIEAKLEKMRVINAIVGDLIVAAGTSLILVIAISIIVRRIAREEKKLLKVQTQLLQNEKIFTEFTNNVEIIFYRISADLTKMLYVSSAYEKIWGKDRTPLYQNTKEWSDSIFPADQEIIYETFLEELILNSTASAEYRIKRPDGSRRNIFDRAFQLKDTNNNVFCFIGIAIDMTNVKLGKKFLQTQLDILSILEHEKTINAVAPKVLKLICQTFEWDLGELWLIDEPDKVLRCVNIWHKETYKMVQYEKESRQHSFKYGEGFPGTIWKEKNSLWMPDYSAKNFSRSEDAQQAKLNCAFGVPILFQDKIFGIMNFFSYNIQNPDKESLALMNTVGKFMGEFIQRTYTNDQIQIISRHDFLTGLLNRSTIEEDLDKLLENKKLKMLAILVLDVDRFRLINEALGSDAGDLILQLMAKKLENLPHYEHAHIARLSADKFILCCFKLNHIDDVLDYSHKIERTLKQPFKVGQNEIFLTVTIGIAIYPQDGVDSKTLITNADLAMTHAKKNGGNKSVFFTKALPGIALEKLIMHTDLREAITKNQFFLNYQPQIDLVSGDICGAEALVRWQHPVRGLVSPVDFISCAEETRLIILLNEHVMRMVFQQVNSSWTGPPVSVNISAQQFNDKYQLVEYLESLMSEFSVNPKHIELEITENMVMENTQHTLAVLGAIHHLGFSVAIDDFGVGFSSFNYLYRIPAEKIKIDRSFIKGIPGDSTNTEIVRSMIVMLHAMKKFVVAEGAESSEEIKFLKQEKCDIVQGYYYYKPMSIEAFLALIAQLNISKPSH